MRTYWLESEQNNLVNRYRFLNKKYDDGLPETDSRVSDTKVEMSALSDQPFSTEKNDYQNSTISTASSSGGNTLTCTESDMMDHGNDQPVTPLLAEGKATLAKSAST